VTVLVWLASALGIALAGLVGLVSLLVAGALLSLLRVDGRVDAAGASGRIRWGVVGATIDASTGTATLRLAGLRLVRRPLRGGSRDGGSDDAEPETEDEDAATGANDARGPRLRLGAYRRLARTGLHELRRMARHVHVRRAMLDLTLASDDPAWTGEAYGVGCAVLAWLRSIWPQAELRLSSDFTATRPYGAAELAASVRPVRLLPGVTRVALRYWTERRRARRRASGARATAAPRF
jgi:hypothetical protein